MKSFGPNMSCCLKTERILLVIAQKCPKETESISVFLSHGKLKLEMEKSSVKSDCILLPSFCVNPVFLMQCLIVRFPFRIKRTLTFFVEF